MSADRCVIVIAGIVDDRAFGHMCFIAECLSTILPNFYYRSICKDRTEWKHWLDATCAIHGWSHHESPLVWKAIGITHSNVNYIGGSYQFWELLHRYYNITSYLTEDDLDALQSDLLFAHAVGKQKSKELDVPEERRRITIIGAGRSMCPDLVCQLLMLQELWLNHGVVINLYDEPGCFFKLKKIHKDAVGVGAGLNAVVVLNNVPDALKDCHILIYLDAITREDLENTYSLLIRNYKYIEELSLQINEHAPPYMKVLLCSTGFTCYFADIMHRLVTKLPSTSIVAVSAHYGLELIHALARSVGLPSQNFGCPPVWGYLGINQFIDIDHMIKKCYIYEANRRALTSNKSRVVPARVQHSELRWVFYLSHNKTPYKDNLKTKALTLYQVGRAEDFPKCKAICDLLKLWYSKDECIGEEIISLGIVSDGSFGIPKGLTFSQPVYLKVLEDRSRVWVPFRDFPMPNMSHSIFQNFIDTAVVIKEKMTILKEDSKHQFL